jgi:hypothetical protein
MFSSRWPVGRPGTWSFLLLLGACSDYTLNGEEDRDRPDRDTADDLPVDGPQPDIVVEPSTLSFGWRLVNCPAEPQTVTVKNVGDKELDVSELRLVGTGAARFLIDGSGQKVAPGGSFTFQVGFTAEAVTEYAVQVEVVSNDPDERVSQVEAKGAGALTATNEEVFVQPDVSDVDVLWVVDNSGSMSEIVNYLGDRFKTFLDSFSRMDIDWRIGVVSTDMDNPAQAGKLQGPKPWIEPTDSNPQGLFQQATDLGSSGSGSERGMDAAYAALTSPLADNENKGFLRADAVLAVVVISDENDSSNISNSDFIRWIDGLKPDADRTSLSAVVGDYDGSAFGIGCSSSGFPPVTAEPGERYVKVQQATGGTFQSICDEDFDEVLSYLAFGASGLQFEFPLSKVPLSIGGIKVSVDGVDVPRNITNGWFYDARANAVRFARSAVPGPNAVILITYPVDEDC